MRKKCYHFFGGLLNAQTNWLNKMSEKGYRLIRAGKMLYEFEECKPNEVKYCVEFIGEKSKENAKDYSLFLEDMGYKVFFKNINLNYSVGKVRWRPWAEKGGRIATNTTTFNRELLIKELGKQLKKLGMLIIQDQIWGRVTQNRSQGRATWYFADEFHLLLKEEQTAAYSAEIWKRFRKWGGVPTGATQNVKDLLSSPEIENILENSDFITLLNQASGDRKILSERLNLSADQQKYIDNSEPGEGLLIFENVVLPFSNPIPKNTQLYKIMTTRLSEVVEL